MDEIDQLKHLAGVTVESKIGSNISLTASEKAKLMREHNIQPGTEAWFKLWFSRPYLTGEKPI